jgi:hypothetical protein
MTNLVITGSIPPRKGRSPEMEFLGFEPTILEFLEERISEFPTVE